MPTSFQLDHLVLIVDDLDAAIADYRALGFTVQFGGVHGDGQSHNALIAFQDGSYLELFALRRRGQTRLARALHTLGLLTAYTRSRNPIARRFAHSVALGEGLADVALLTDDLEAVVERGRQTGMVVDGAPSSSCGCGLSGRYLREAPTARL